MHFKDDSVAWRISTVLRLLIVNAFLLANTNNQSASKIT